MLNKTKPKPGNQTFRLILNSVAVENSLRLMGRARTANKLAKSVIGKSRIGAYAVKSWAVFALMTNFPEHVRIVHDFSTPGFILVKAPAYRFAVHAPTNFLSRASNAIAS
jgi:hypothetical protein